MLPTAQRWIHQQFHPPLWKKIQSFECPLQSFLEFLKPRFLTFRSKFPGKCIFVVYESAIHQFEGLPMLSVLIADRNLS